MRSVTYVLLISTGLMATPSTLLAGAGDLPYKIDNNDFDPATLIWHTESAEIWDASWVNQQKKPALIEELVWLGLRFRLANRECR